MKVNLLKAKMVEYELSQEGLLTALKDKGINLSRTSLSRRFSNEVEFTRDEIEAIIFIFKLSPDETSDIFFSR